MSLFSTKIRIFIFKSFQFTKQSTFFTLQRQVTSVLASVGTEMEYIETKGGRKLSKDGFFYIKNKTLTNGRTYWECAQRRSGNGCNIKITLDAADRCVAQTHQRTHAADSEGNDLLKARARIKQSTKDTAEKTENIIAANIASLQENVLVRLPNIETIRRDVRRNRPSNHPAVPDIDIYLI